MRKLIDILLERDKESAKKAKLFLLGMLTGMLFLFSIILVILKDEINFTAILWIPEKVAQTNLNLDNYDIYQLLYYKGAMDTHYFRYTNTFICRYNNLDSAMLYVSENNAYYNSTIYLLFDQTHIRSAVWYNNTLIVFDVSDPAHNFKIENSEIIRCTVSKVKYHGMNCTIIYYNGLYRIIGPEDKYAISKLLGINIS